MHTLRVATLNVWNKSGPWPERREVLRRQLAELQPDLLALQEVLRFDPALAPAELAEVSDQAEEIAAGFGYSIAYAPAADLGNGLSIGNALLSRFPLVESLAFALPHAGTDELRSLLYARVQTPAGDCPVFVTHLSWRFHHGFARLEQLHFILDRIEALCPASSALPPLLIGDLNAEPDADEMRYLRGLHTIDGRGVFYSDAWIYAGSGPGYTFDRENHFAALAREAPRRIDYLYVRSMEERRRTAWLSARLAFTQCEHTAQGPVWASDHFGVFAELGVGPAPG